MASTRIAAAESGRRRSIAAGCLRWLAGLAGTTWAAGAIYVDGPLGMTSGNAWLAAAWIAATLALLAVAASKRKRLVVWLACFLIVALPWIAKRPSNEHDWKRDWAQLGWVVTEGDSLTFHNFRNFGYGLDGSVDERWEIRTVKLSNLRGLDYFHDAFGGDLMAHPILSFDFGPDGRVALSIETRRERGESFSKIGGLYKMFELPYLWGDERDLIRVRTNIHNEPVYLYRSTFTVEQARAVLLDSIRIHNELKDRPRFYNVVTANCTTSIRAQTPKSRRAKFDYRLLANGRLDELIYERGAIHTNSLSFPALRERALINSVARAAHDDSNFSARIRQGRPGF